MMKIVTTKQGKLSGKQMDGYTVFYGIPYAKPPVGSRRFRPPEEPESYAGIREAGRLPNRLWQSQAAPGTPSAKEFCFAPEYLPPMSEDGLFVHIWTPAKEPGETLPVALWIHGGAFIKGFGAEVAYDGAGFCRRGVILVSIDYRMGPFGFLCHPWLTQEGGGRCGNYGLLDQIAALSWVRENIAAFGGDPRRITIMGQSAGAISVQALVSSHLTEGMFAGAVMQSAGGYRSPIGTRTAQREAERDGEELAAICGAKTLEELRALPPETLVAASEALAARYPNRLVLAPVLDGYVLAETLDRIAETGGHRDIPYLLGATADDLCAEDGRTLTDCAVDWSLLNLRLGRKPAYVYRFDRVPPGGHGAYAGAYHSAELWYLFGTWRRSWRPYTEADAALSEQIADYWCNFVKTGDPNGEGLPYWEPCAANATVQILDVHG